MAYTLKTFFDNADIKGGIIERIYSYSIFCVIFLYWVYSPQILYDRFVVLEFTPIEMLSGCACYSMLLTSSLCVIYFNTRDSITNWLKGKIKPRGV